MIIYILKIIEPKTSYNDSQKVYGKGKDRCEFQENFQINNDRIERWAPGSIQEWAFSIGNFKIGLYRKKGEQNTGYSRDRANRMIIFWGTFEFSRSMAWYWNVFLF